MCLGAASDECMNAHHTPFTICAGGTTQSSANPCWDITDTEELRRTPLHCGDPVTVVQLGTSLLKEGIIVSKSPGKAGKPTWYGVQLSDAVPTRQAARDGTAGVTQHIQCQRSGLVAGHNSVYYALLTDEVRSDQAAASEVQASVAEQSPPPPPSGKPARLHSASPPRGPHGRGRGLGATPSSRGTSSSASSLSSDTRRELGLNPGDRVALLQLRSGRRISARRVLAPVPAGPAAPEPGPPSPMALDPDDQAQPEAHGAPPQPAAVPLNAHNLAAHNAAPQPAAAGGGDGGSGGDSSGGGGSSEPASPHGAADDEWLPPGGVGGGGAGAAAAAEPADGDDAASNISAEAGEPPADDDDAPPYEPDMHPGNPNYKAPRQPPPLPHKYRRMGPRQVCGKVARNAAGDPIVDDWGRVIRCEAMLWPHELRTRPCCKNGTSHLWPVVGPDPELHELYNSTHRAFHWGAESRSMNLRFTLSMMCCTNGGHMDHHDALVGNAPGHAPLGMLKCRGLTNHALPFADDKDTYRQHWNVVPPAPAGQVGGGLEQRRAQLAHQTGAWLQANNHLRQSFGTLRERLADGNVQSTNVSIRFRGQPGTQDGAPAAEEAANLAAGEHGPYPHGYHIVAVKRDAAGNWRNHRLRDGEPGFFAMQYVLLYPHGWGDWHEWRRMPVLGADGQPQLDDDGNPVMRNVREPYKDAQGNELTLRKYTQRALYQFRHFAQCSTLTEQWLLDSHNVNEARKLRFDIQRRERMRGVNRAAAEARVQQAGGQPVAADAVGRPYHNASFVGSPAYYALNKRRALAILARCGKPSYFVTFTCNPRWPEIVEALEPGQTWRERPDLCARVFKEKKRQLLDDLRKGFAFRDAEGNLQKAETLLWVIEYQKRGLPHVHIAVRTSGEQPVTAAAIDRNVSAMLPTGATPEDRYVDNMLQASMAHKCGASCGGDKGNCKYRYPKCAQAHTEVRIRHVRHCVWRRCFTAVCSVGTFWDFARCCLISFPNACGALHCVQLTRHLPYKYRQQLLILIHHHVTPVYPKPSTAAQLLQGTTPLRYVPVFKLQPTFKF